METGSAASDMGIGLAMAFGAVALVGAVVMLASSSQQLTAGAFAAAMTAAIVGTVAVHAFSE